MKKSLNLRNLNIGSIYYLFKFLKYGKNKLYRQHLAYYLFLLITLFVSQESKAQNTFRFNSIEYYTLKHVSSKLGMQHKWIINKKSAQLRSKWTRIDFINNKRDIKINGVKTNLGNAIVYSKKYLCISKFDYDKLIAPILTPQLSKKIPRLKTIVIDPGHGGKDPGALNKKNGLTEKKLTLNMAIRLQRILSEKGFKVYITRKKDEFIDLSARAIMSNKIKADLFISLHFNASENNAVSGIETYIYTPQHQPSSSRTNLLPSDKKFYPANKNDAWNSLVGFYLHRELITKLRAKDRGLKRARFTVLQALDCPGVLVEGGFITNINEANKIKSSQYQRQYLKSLVDGILIYKKTLVRLKS